MKQMGKWISMQSSKPNIPKCRMRCPSIPPWRSGAPIRRRSMRLQMIPFPTSRRRLLVKSSREWTRRRRSPFIRSMLSNENDWWIMWMLIYKSRSGNKRDPMMMLFLSPNVEWIKRRVRGRLNHRENYLMILESKVWIIPYPGTSTPQSESRPKALISVEIPNWKFQTSHPVQANYQPKSAHFWPETPRLQNATAASTRHRAASSVAR